MATELVAAAVTARNLNSPEERWKISRRAALQLTFSWGTSANPLDFFRKIHHKKLSLQYLDHKEITSIFMANRVEESI